MGAVARGDRVRAVRLNPELVLVAIAAPAAVDDGLTSGERHSAHLAAQGLSNAAIAVRRKSSPRTVANVLARVYRKLGVNGRRELRARLGRRS